MRNNRLAVIAALLANAVLWGLMVFPMVIQVLQRGKVPKTGDAGNRSSVLYREYSYDFSKIRDPFSVSGFQNDMKIMRSSTNEIRNTENAQPLSRVEFHSRFRLKSVVKMEGGYSATLEEEPKYSVSEQFIVENEEETLKSFLIKTGDEVLGEKVVKISSDNVILEKNGQYYKLTFNGGTAVPKP